MSAAAFLCGVLRYPIITSQQARRSASFITALPVKRGGVRGASCIICLVSVKVCPFLFCVPITECVSAMDQPPFTAHGASNGLVRSPALGRCQPWFDRTF